MNAEVIRLWRTVIGNMTHDGGDGESSHPYQVLLRLVARCPGITRAKCALALEAKNDSDRELDSIVGLSEMDEAAIRATIGVSESNWDNAKKILPRFAEQLGDVQKRRQQFHLNDAPGVEKVSADEPEPTAVAQGPRRPRSASAVTSSSIAKSGRTDDWDEADDSVPPEVHPDAARARMVRIRRRLQRHNAIVQRIAKLLEAEGAELFENPFDCLACFPDEGLLIEVKSLDGTPTDEMARVRDALGQLLYYESFVTKPLVKKRAIRKVACFENEVSSAHIAWLQASDIQVLWVDGKVLDGTTEAKAELAGHFSF